MEVAVQVVLVRHAFGRTNATGIFEDWWVGPSFKVMFETAFWLEPVATATGIADDSQRQFQFHQSLKRPLLCHVSTIKIQRCKKSLGFSPKLF
ncbi:hypothetical protein [Lactiplantibacillus fabifermentans]|nr:hypothetical protein [Lactiplantibacillus fabifermentans]KRO26629.1 hypothetical protein DY78_GL000739 [Lactiplantibacillus fabifermentans DSM 21115]